MTRLDLDEVERVARHAASKPPSPAPWNTGTVHADPQTLIAMVAELRAARESSVAGWRVVQVARQYPYIQDLADAVEDYDQAVNP